MIVVSDSSPIIALSIIDRLDILQSLYSELVVSEAVYQEITAMGKARLGTLEVLSANWIMTGKITNKILFNKLL